MFFFFDLQNNVFLNLIYNAIMRELLFRIFFVFVIGTNGVLGQVQKLSLEMVIDTLSLQSPKAEIQRLNYNSQQLSFENYQKSMLPSFSFTANPLNMNRSLRLLQDPGDGQYTYVEDYSNNSTLGLNVRQRVPLTGGEISLRTDINYLYEFTQKRNSFNTTPLAFGYSQKLIGSRKLFAMEKQLEFKRNDNSIKQYCLSLSEIQEEALRLFISTLLNYMECDLNYATMVSNDTLVFISKKKYEYGGITEFELNQIEIQSLNSRYEYENSQKLYVESMQNLSTFLGLGLSKFEIKLPIFDLPIKIDQDRVFGYVERNNPFLIEQQITMMEAEQSFYTLKLNNQINGNVGLNYGINQFADNFIDAYKRGNTRQSVMVSFQIPIMQWGINRNKTKIGQNKYDQAIISNQMKKDQFKNEVLQVVNKYNSSVKLWFTAEKFYKLAQEQYHLMVRKYDIGKISVYELTNAQSELKQVMQHYYSAIRDVYVSYFNLRSKSLYDFKSERDLRDILIL